MVNKINLLDCTLRDGGYVNNWDFGYTNIIGILKGLENSNINIIELGFLRDEEENNNKTSFASIQSINKLLKKKKNIIYSAMIEAFNPYPINKIQPCTKSGIDLIRICVWKRLLKEHLEYCQQVKLKGYPITIQPSRVEQYSNSEFIELIKKSNELRPYAVYVVDTWGTQSSEQIKKYLELADKYLDKDVKLGYHGHNNKMQALSCAQTVLNMKLNHELCLDSSIFGMGRGAGNLNTEIIAEYLNESLNTNFDTLEIFKTFYKYIQPIYKKYPWGYSFYYFLSSITGCNPNFATYFKENNIDVNLFSNFLNTLTEKEKIVCNPDFINNRLREIKGKQ